MKRYFLSFFLFLCAASLSAQTWIWYPGDYEIWLGNKMNNRRTERGAFFPPFWKIDSPYNMVEFSKALNLSKPETIQIAVEGEYNVKFDGKLQFGMPHTFYLPAGKHQLNIKVFNQTALPTLYINGETVKSDSSWKVTYEDKEWIDESGKVSDKSATIYMNAGYWNFNDIKKPATQFTLPVKAEEAVSTETVSGGQLFDFGKETFGYLRLEGLKGTGDIHIYYGESREEALDTLYCETLDKLHIDANGVTDLSLNQTTATKDYTMSNSKAFRYVYVTADPSVNIGHVGMNYEYMPETNRGTFRCNDEELNKIWDVGVYTLQLTTREFFIDGIKRDRWVWSGDAVQSYLMNYYLFFDSDAVKRTTWLLRGKDPVTSHINTIMDYTFYWFISIYDYYMYTGDKTFVSQIYPRMKTMMDFVLGRTDKNGMVEGQTGDWVFIDWADGYLDKKGEVSFEQVLFCRSLETMALCATLTDNVADRQKYEGLASKLKAKLLPTFWNEKKQALVHNVVDNRQSTSITRYANMFATLYGYLSGEQQEEIKHSVLLNDSILKITTPYMRFYELEALCALGEQNQVMKEMKAYWGGMLREGATSFWEKYNPAEHGTEHLAMYARPYGKSLCHAWGASPIYLLGKYYLGVHPVKAGYEEYAIHPVLGGLQWMEGTVPTPQGGIHVYMNKKQIKVKADGGRGYLTFTSRKKPKTNIGTIEKLGNEDYRILINTKEEVVIDYK